MKRYTKFLRLSSGFVAAAFILGVALVATGCSRGRFQTASGLVWNTEYHVTFRGPASLADSIPGVFDSVGRSLSVFDASSLVSRLNASDSVTADTHLEAVYGMSRRVNRASGGMFDPTLSPLITAWGFGPGHKATADTLRIDSLLALTGIGRTSLRGHTLVKPAPGMAFNFSAVAKGYGSDCVAEMLRRHGVTDLMVEIGGEIRVCGKNPEGGKWVISIDRPDFADGNPQHVSQAIIEVTDCGIATSGNYRNLQNGAGGIRYGHTISPLTGRPAPTDVASATVVASSCMEADAFATACVALGVERSLAMADREHIAVMLVDTTMMVTVNSAFQRLIPSTSESGEPGGKSRD